MDCNVLNTFPENSALYIIWCRNKAVRLKLVLFLIHVLDCLGIIYDCEHVG